MVEPPLWFVIFIYAVLGATDKLNLWTAESVMLLCDLIKKTIKGFCVHTKRKECSPEIEEVHK